MIQEVLEELQKPRVPSPPPVTAEETLLGADNENRHKKKLKKKLEKAHLIGQKLDEDVFRAIYGAGVISNSYQPFSDIHYMLSGHHDKAF